MLKIVHLVNFFECPPHSEDWHSQQLTFVSIKNALQAANEIPEVTVEFFTTHFENELLPINEHIENAGFLTKSVNQLPGLTASKRLPLISEIIKSLCRIEADYYIYTNADICLKPNFYKFVSAKIKSGHDAIVINRRRIPYAIYTDKDLPYLFSVKGKKHPGFDCFVFKNGLQQGFQLYEICVGIPFVEASLFYNLWAFANNPILFPDEDLTFHVGMEIFKKRDKKLYWHNRNTFFNHVKPALWQNLRAKKLPWYEEGFPIRYYRWAVNPALFTLMNIKIEIRDALAGY